MYLANNNTISDELFLSTDLRTVHPEQSVIFVASNRGRTYRLFDNPHHRRALASMGLRPETAFGCAFRFLFEPNAFVKVRQILAVVRDDRALIFIASSTHPTTDTRRQTTANRGHAADQEGAPPTGQRA